MSEGTRQEARLAFWLLDSQWLVQMWRTDLEAEKRPFAQPHERLAQWRLTQPGRITLQEIVAQVHPTILIGTSARPGAFTEDIVHDRAEHVECSIIFPLWRAQETGKAPEAVAELVFQAVREGRFYILTHPKRNWQIRDRMEDILLGHNPTGTTRPHTPHDGSCEAERR